MNAQVIESSVVLGALLVAVLLVLIAAASDAALSPTVLRERMGPISFDFSKSWASSFTVVGGILGSILSAKGVVPDKPQFMPAPSYAALNLLFVVTVILAAFVYRATSTPANTASPQGGTDVQYQGFVWGFLIASALTLWAVVGELATTLLLFGEISSQSAYSQPVFWLFFVLVLAVAVLVLAYAVMTLRWTISYQRDKTTIQQNHAARMGVAGIAPPAGSSVPLPAVTLL